MFQRRPDKVGLRVNQPHLFFSVATCRSMDGGFLLGDVYLEDHPRTWIRG